MRLVRGPCSHEHGAMSNAGERGASAGAPNNQRPTPQPTDASTPAPAPGEPALAAFARAVLRMPRSLTTMPRLPARAAALAADRLATLGDVAEAVASRGGVRATVAAASSHGMLRAVGGVAGGLAKTTVCGTLLFSCYEAVVSAAPAGTALFAPFAAGAVGGAAHGVTSTLLSAAGATARERLASIRGSLLHTAAADSLEWGVGLGCFAALRRATSRPTASDAAHDAHLTPDDAASLAASALLAGSAQMAVAARVGGAPITPRAIGVAALGLVAFELAQHLD